MGLNSITQCASTQVNPTNTIIIPSCNIISTYRIPATGSSNTLLYVTDTLQRYKYENPPIEYKITEDIYGNFIIDDHYVLPRQLIINMAVRAIKV